MRRFWLTTVNLSKVTQIVTNTLDTSPGTVSILPPLLHGLQCSPLTLAQLEGKKPGTDSGLKGTHVQLPPPHLQGKQGSRSGRGICLKGSDQPFSIILITSSSQGTLWLHLRRWGSKADDKLPRKFTSQTYFSWFSCDFDFPFYS